MKKNLLAGAMALALIGCSEQAAEEAASADAAPATEAASDAAAERSADAATPGIAPTVAPGVAFDYSYAFRLDDDRISRVQQDHAEACELLGVSRCRIADVRYGLNDQKNVEAQTHFKLDPGIARRFGADAIASVEKAEGVLAEASVAGEDVGSQITASQQRSVGNAAEIERLENRLKQGGLAKAERAELLRQIGNLRGELDQEQASRRQGEARIASTSVVFTYLGNGGLPGIGHDNPFSKAGETFIRSGGTALSIILTVGAAILPWAIILGLLVLLMRSIAMRNLRRSLGKLQHPEAELQPPA
jgi:Domain of unknown function (DUF4349)